MPGRSISRFKSGSAELGAVGECRQHKRYCDGRGDGDRGGDTRRLPAPSGSRRCLEILLGILVAPQILGLVHPGITLSTLANFGLAMVPLMAGFEIDPAVLQGRPIWLALTGWGLVCALSFGAALLLSTFGLITPWLFTGLVLTTTAIGVLFPILRDSLLLVPPYGPIILAVGAIGEAGPIVLLSLLLAGGAAPIQAVVMVCFCAAVVATMVLASRASNGRFGNLVARTIPYLRPIADAAIVRPPGLLCVPLGLTA
jgi:Kef-type K+ transport system membrane component KefB